MHERDRPHDEQSKLETKEQLRYRNLCKTMKDNFAYDKRVGDEIYSPTECYVFADTLDVLMKSLRDCYVHYKMQRVKDEAATLDLPSDIAKSFEKILQETLRMLEVSSQDEIDIKIAVYADFIVEIQNKYAELDQEVSQKWAAIYSAMRKFTVTEFQECVNENIKFITALENSDEDVKAAGFKLQKKVCNMQKNPRPGLPAAVEIFRRSNEVMYDPIQYDHAYQHYANTVEGKPSKEQQALGYTMKIFGALAFLGGLLTMGAFIFVQPTFMLTTIVGVGGLAAMWIGGKCIEKGNRHIEAGQAKKLSNKMTLFGGAVSNSADNQYNRNNPDLIPLVTTRVYGV